MEAAMASAPRHADGVLSVSSSHVSISGVRADHHGGSGAGARGASVVRVILDDPVYVPGDTLTGYVEIATSTPLIFVSLHVRVKGEERSSSCYFILNLKDPEEKHVVYFLQYLCLDGVSHTQLKQSKSRRRWPFAKGTFTKHTGSTPFNPTTSIVGLHRNSAGTTAPFFNSEGNVSHGAGEGGASTLISGNGLLPGVYRYPLRLRLPEYVPPSFDYNEGMKGHSSVLYTAKATLVLLSNRKLRGTTEFAMRALPLPRWRWVCMSSEGEEDEAAAKVAAAAAKEATAAGDGNPPRQPSSALFVESNGRRASDRLSTGSDVPRPGEAVASNSRIRALEDAVLIEEILESDDSLPPTAYMARNSRHSFVESLNSDTVTAAPGVNGDWCAPGPASRFGVASLEASGDTDGLIRSALSHPAESARMITPSSSLSLSREEPDDTGVHVEQLHLNCRRHTVVPSKRSFDQTVHIRKLLLRGSVRIIINVDKVVVERGDSITARVHIDNTRGKAVIRHLRVMLENRLVFVGTTASNTVFHKLGSETFNVKIQPKEKFDLEPVTFQVPPCAPVSLMLSGFRSVAQITVRATVSNSITNDIGEAVAFGLFIVDSIDRKALQHRSDHWGTSYLRHALHPGAETDNEIICSRKDGFLSRGDSSSHMGMMNSGAAAPTHNQSYLATPTFFPAVAGSRQQPDILHMLTNPLLAPRSDPVTQAPGALYA